MMKGDFTSITRAARTLSLVLPRLMALAFLLSYAVYFPYHLASEPHSQHFGEAATHPMDQSGSDGTDSSSDHRHASLDHSFQVALKKTGQARTTTDHDFGIARLGSTSDATQVLNCSSFRNYSTINLLRSGRPSAAASTPRARLAL